METKDLLNYTKQIILEQKAKREESGEYFNIFSILGKERDEVHTHCNFLYELLSPNGTHFKKDTFLKLFFEIVLEQKYPQDSYVTVKREFAFDKESRLDLLIRGKEFCYPIEVKIDALEQSRQLDRYCNWAKKQAKNIRVYYLTLDGKKAISATGKNKELVSCISFEGHILQWLSACMNEVQNNVPLYEGIHQYYNLLKKITGQGDDCGMSNVKAQILASAENFESAQTIYKALMQAKADTMKNFFDTIADYIGNRLEKINADYKEKTDLYYTPGKGGSFPSLSYVLYQEENYCLALRFEIQNTIYFGVAFYRMDENARWLQIENPNAWEKDVEDRYNPFQVKSASNWFSWWKYLTVENERIDFHRFNDKYIYLYDEQKKRVVYESIFEQIDTYFNAVGII